MPAPNRTLVLAVMFATAVAAAGCSGAPSSRQQRTSSPPPKPAHAAANFDPSLAGAVACSSLIVTGTVVRVVDGDPGRTLTTLRVRDWVKPSSGPAATTIDTVDIAAGGRYQRWQPGEQLNLAIDVDPSVLPNWEIDAHQFARYRGAVAEAATMQCPYGPS